MAKKFPANVEEELQAVAPKQPDKLSLNKVNIQLMQKGEYFVSVGKHMKAKLICFNVRYAINGTITNALDFADPNKMLKVLISIV